MNKQDMIAWLKTRIEQLENALATEPMNKTGALQDEIERLKSVLKEFEK